MKKNTISKVYSTPYQLRLPIEMSIIIDVNDPVYSFTEVMYHIDLKKYFAEEGCRTGRPRCDAVKLLKVILFAFMENGYTSLRELEKLCRTDVRYIWMLNNSNSSSSFLSQALEEMKKEQGEKFSLETINLAELQRRTGISRQKLRTLKKREFKDECNSTTSKKIRKTVLTGYTSVIDSMLRSNVSNSVVIYDRLKEVGYKGGLTQVKVYISQHRDLLPPKRQIMTPHDNRGRRFSTEAGESYQMDWGFTDVLTYDGTTFSVACFAMICHHCGERYVEFFPNAK